MKKGIAAGIAVCAVIFALVSWSGRIQSKEQEVQHGIADKIIRFHVLANSDTQEDQALKLKVKDEVVEEMKGLLKDVSNVEETREVIQSNLEDITQYAANVVEQEGYAYPVQTELTSCYFPVKAYGDLVFPDGEYETLRITIGEAEGQNWWCVMYPRLCFVDSLHAVVPEESKNELREVLTEEEYRQVLYGGEEKIKVKWKFLEWLQSLGL